MPTTPKTDEERARLLQQARRKIKRFLRGEMNYRVEIHAYHGGGWHWRVLALNGQIVGNSAEAYVKKSHAKKMAAKLFPKFPIAGSK